MQLMSFVRYTRIIDHKYYYISKRDYVTFTLNNKLKGNALIFLTVCFAVPQA